MLGPGAVSKSLSDRSQRSAREPFVGDAIQASGSGRSASARGKGGYRLNVEAKAHEDRRGSCTSNRTQGHHHSESARDWDAEGGEGPPAEPGCEGVLFPMRPFRCLPAQIRACIPYTWQVIQDSTHLVLVVGIICACGLLATEIALIYRGHGSWFWHKEIIVIVMLLMNVSYLFEVISHYDESIRVREKSIASRKKDLIKEYEGLVEGIDELLGKATQSSATLAEAGFESKRRDFIRFLDRVEERSQIMAMTVDVDEKLLVQQFKLFVKHWLGVFSECSIDPINKPKYVLTDSELNGLKTIQEVAHLVKERLRNTEVRFISQAHDQDVKMLRGFQKTHRRLSEPVKASDIAPWSQPQHPPEIELMSHSNNNRRPDPQVQAHNSLRSNPPRSSTRVSPSVATSCTCTWCVLGPSECSYSTGANPDGFPKYFQCKCARIKLLSPEHVGLIFGFLLGVLLTGLVVFNTIDKDPEEFNWLLLPGWGYLLAVLVLLIRFEQLDIIQKLEREIFELQEEKEKLSARREEMVKFWSDMQALTDIWVCRTTPRLDLLKEVHCSLEDIKQPKELVTALSDTNSRLEMMESRLPELTMWRRDSIIGEEPKKRFAQQVKAVYCRADQDLPTILDGVSHLCEDSIPRLGNVEKHS